MADILEARSAAARCATPAASLSGRQGPHELVGGKCSTVKFKGVPVSDAPILIADKPLVSVRAD